jgi:hypothetical protein
MRGGASAAGRLPSLDFAADDFATPVFDVGYDLAIAVAPFFFQPRDDIILRNTVPFEERDRVPQRIVASLISQPGIDPIQESPQLRLGQREFSYRAYPLFPLQVIAESLTPGFIYFRHLRPVYYERNLTPGVIRPGD